MAKVAGSIWVEGNDIHYVDQFAREWMMVGILVGAVTAKPGSLWFSTTDYIFHYINEAGDGHYRIASQPLNVPNANAVAGSLWIGEDNCIHWINFFRAGAPNWHSHSHIDVPPVSSHVDTHTDTHGDTPHSDSAHVDGAHTDIPGGSTHIDYHYDVPHNDFNDSYHGDFGDVIYDHGDFNDAVYYYHPSFQHLDGAYYHYHGDYLSAGQQWHTDYTTIFVKGSQGAPPTQHDDTTLHYDSPHADSPHVDAHNDAPHQDTPPGVDHNDHTDSTPHQDVPHNDVPHGDGHNDVHSDTHTDTHTDTGHFDQPILIGP
jgi:hypothetical protein